jgi:hypothetical protein
MSEGAEADGLDLEAISSGEADAGHGHGGAKMEGGGAAKPKTKSSIERRGGRENRAPPESLLPAP